MKKLNELFFMIWLLYFSIVLLDWVNSGYEIFRIDRFFLDLGADKGNYIGTILDWMLMIYPIIFGCILVRKGRSKGG
ncbi:MAG: hypothetical protein ABJ360_02255 [Roseobacter sp.]|uniref:hypothetical protein n=1 Tax=Parasphingorhabdus sp. TaxID=2709688 RepID=UPI0032636558